MLGYSLSGVEEHRDDQNVTHLVTVNFTLTLPTKQTIPLPIYSPPLERILPVLQAIGESTSDAIVVVLNSLAEPIYVNGMGMKVLHINALAHPPMAKLGPGNESPVDELTSDFKEMHCTDFGSSSHTFSFADLKLKRFYESNWINTWIPEDRRDEIWDCYNSVVYNFAQNGVIHNFSHLLNTTQGLKIVHTTGVPIFDPESKCLLFAVHFIHLDEVKDDPRVSTLSVDLQSMLDEDLPS